MCNENVTYTFDFTELPESVKITEQSITGENAELIKLPKGLLSDDLLAVSKLLSCRVSFPTTFFDQNNEVLQRNIKQFLSLLKVCLLNKCGVKVGEKTASNSYSTHEAKSETIPQNR